MISLFWFGRRIQMRMFQTDFYEKLYFQAWFIMLIKAQFDHYDFNTIK